MTHNQPFNADAPTATLRPERIQVRAAMKAGAELRPERIQLQSRLDGLLAEPNWAINPAGDAPGSLVGVFQRPDKEGTAYLVHLLTEVSGHFGVEPEVAFQGEFARVTFDATAEEISREQMGFARLIQDLYPTVDGLVLQDGGSDGPIVDDAPGETGGDVVIDPTAS